jgi:hypothetical protein
MGDGDGVNAGGVAGAGVGGTGLSLANGSQES